MQMSIMIQVVDVLQKVLKVKSPKPYKHFEVLLFKQYLKLNFLLVSTSQKMQKDITVYGVDIKRNTLSHAVFRHQFYCTETNS